MVHCITRQNGQDVFKALFVRCCPQDPVAPDGSAVASIDSVRNFCILFAMKMLTDIFFYHHENNNIRKFFNITMYRSQRGRKQGYRAPIAYVTYNWTMIFN